jgi:hypothetical protein
VPVMRTVLLLIDLSIVVSLHFYNRQDLLVGL